MQINTAAIQKLQEEAERAAQQPPPERKIIQFPTKEVVEYFEGIAGDDDPIVPLNGTHPPVEPVDPDLKQRYHQEVEAARQRRLERQFGPMIVPAAFQDLSPWSLVEQYGDQAKRGKVEAIKAAAAWAGVDLSTGKKVELATKFPGLLLWGPPGTGKSALAWWAVQQRGWGLWIAWNEFLGKVQDEWQGREALIEAAQQAPVLFLDDLGDPWATNGRLTDDRRTILFRIVNRRLAYQLPTIITSNVDGGNLDIVLVRLEQMFDQRIVDRLWELCQFVEMGGLNLRKAPKKG